MYLALNMTLNQTQATRDASDIEDLNRGVINQMSVDLAATLGPLPPKATASSSGGSGGGGRFRWHAQRLPTGMTGAQQRPVY